MYIFIGNFSISEKNAYENPFVNFEKIKSSVKLWIINFKIKWVIGGVNVMESFLIHTDIQKKWIRKFKKIESEFKARAAENDIQSRFHMKILNGW